MSSVLENLEFFDLLRERHIQVRSIIEKRWNDSSNIYISNSEWFILSRIYQQEPTISSVSKQVNISRQATHKVIKNLEAKGLLKIKNLENNKKDKCVHLTELGEKCYQEYIELKANLEKKIIEQIGDEQFRLLKAIMESDWGLQSLIKESNPTLLGSDS
ncbi:MAG TPA: winged helix DNA-binding protein [Bacillales bacterium]|nr:winged helix DNA-binding protein [Bacillales bacterium]